MTTPDTTGPVRPLPDPHGPEKPPKANDEAISEALAALAENARLRSQLAEAREQRDHAQRWNDEARRAWAVDSAELAVVRGELAAAREAYQRVARACAEIADELAISGDGEIDDFVARLRALAATAPETAPESPHTADPAPEQVQAASEPLMAAEVKLPARLATMRRRLEDAEQAIAEALRLAALIGTETPEAARFCPTCGPGYRPGDEGCQHTTTVDRSVAADSTGRPPRADGADIIRDLRRQLVQEHEAAEWRQRCIDEAIAAIHDAPQEIAPLLPPVAPADLPRAVRALIDRARSQLVEALVRALTAETELDAARADVAALRRQVLAVAEDLERYASDLRPERLPMSERKLAWTLRQIVAGERPEAPETAPESPHTADPAPEQRTGWQRLASDVAEQIIRDLDIADMAAERDRLRTEAAMLRAEREWLADRARRMGIAEAIIAAHGPAHAVSAEAGRLRTEVKRLSARVREWELTLGDLAARCDSGDIPIRLGERYSLAVLREIDRLRDQWRTLATLVEPLGILDADSTDPATLTDRICRWIGDLREDSAYQAWLLGERQQEIDRLRAELEMAEQDRDLARQAAENRQRERDEARAALRQAEQERDEARREWRGLIDRIRTDASARGLDIEPGEDLVDGLLRIIDDRGKDRDDWQRQAEAADSLRAEVERHAGAQCGCDTNGECLARLYEQTRAHEAVTCPDCGATHDPAQCAGEPGGGDSCDCCHAILAGSTPDTGSTT